MCSNHEDIRDSRSAQEITAYCVTLAHELGLTLEDLPFWTSTTLPDMGPSPYGLVLSVTKPFKANPAFCFTCDEVLGYATGTTKAAIESRIRTDLEIRLRDDVAASRDQSCIHGQS